MAAFTGLLVFFDGTVTESMSFLNGAVYEAIVFMNGLVVETITFADGEVKEAFPPYTEFDWGRFDIDIFDDVEFG